MYNQDFENIKDFLGEKNSILCLLNKYYPMIAKEIIETLGINFNESVMCAVIFEKVKEAQAGKTSNSKGNNPDGLSGKSIASKISKGIKSAIGKTSKSGGDNSSNKSINIKDLKKYLEKNIISKYKEIKKSNSEDKEKIKQIKKLIDGVNSKQKTGVGGDLKKYLKSRFDSINNKRPPGAGGMVALTLNKDNKKNDIEKILKELKNKKTIKEAVELISSKKDIIKILYLILLEINDDNNSNKNASKEEMIKYIMNDIKQEGTFTSQLSDEDVLIENFINKVNKYLGNSNKVSKKDIGYMRREEERRREQENKRKVALNSSYELKNKNRYEYYLESIRNKK
jgi:hypothetical protein